jgi:Mn2+/Fe2+ NRAMP family transporter
MTMHTFFTSHCRDLGWRCHGLSVPHSLHYYNIESAVALVVALFINVAVISVFAVGFFGKPSAEGLGLANAGEFLGRKFGQRMVRGALCNERILLHL